MKLYVGNLAWAIDDKKLKEIFSTFGEIIEAVLIKDKYSGRSKGFGFITFANENDAKKAISEMHEKEVEGRPLTVSEAKPMTPRDNMNNRNSHEEPSEAPLADPSQIDQSSEVEIANENSKAEEEEIKNVAEAMEDAKDDKPATENATEAVESKE
jgi:RNA recognition motif-containing protein